MIKTLLIIFMKRKRFNELSSGSLFYFYHSRIVVVLNAGGMHNTCVLLVLVGGLS